MVGAQITSHLSLFLVERKMAVKDSAELEADKRREGERKRLIKSCAKCQGKVLRVRQDRWRGHPGANSQCRI